MALLGIATFPPANRISYESDFEPLVGLPAGVTFHVYGYRDPGCWKLLAEGYGLGADPGPGSLYASPAAITPYLQPLCEPATQEPTP